jgi:hypothetical protein
MLGNFTVLDGLLVGQWAAFHPQTGDCGEVRGWLCYNEAGRAIVPSSSHSQYPCCNAIRSVIRRLKAANEDVGWPRNDHVERYHPPLRLYRTERAVSLFHYNQQLGLAKYFECR